MIHRTFKDILFLIFSFTALQGASSPKNRSDTLSTVSIEESNTPLTPLALRTQLQRSLSRYIQCPKGYELAPERILLLLQGYPLNTLCLKRYSISNALKTKHVRHKKEQ